MVDWVRGEGSLSEGLLSWVVVEGGWHVGSFFKLLVFQMKLLGYFPPVKTIKEVVGASLIGVGLQSGLHARRPRDPHPLLLVVPPVPVEELYCSQQLEEVSSIHVVQIEQQVLSITRQFDCSKLVPYVNVG